MYKSIIKKGKTKLDERASLIKTNLNRIKDLISNSLTNSYVELDYFYLIDVLRKYDYIKGKNRRMLLSKCRVCDSNKLTR